MCFVVDDVRHVFVGGGGFPFRSQVECSPAISCQQTPSDNEPMGSVPLLGYTVVEDDKKNEFSLVHPGAVLCC